MTGLSEAEKLQQSNIINELCKTLIKDNVVAKRFLVFLVENQQLLQARDFRELMSVHHPEQEPDMVIMDELQKITDVLAMVNIKSDVKQTKLIYEAIEKYQEKGGDFSLEDASKIKFDAEQFLKPFGL